MAGKPDSDDVPTLVTTDEDVPVDQLPVIAKARRRQRRRRRKKDSLRPEDVRQRMTVSDDATVVVDNAADTSLSTNSTCRCEHAAHGEDNQEATAAPAAKASRQNFDIGHIEFEVPSELKCSVTLLTFGEWMQVVKDNPQTTTQTDEDESSCALTQ